MLKAHVRSVARAILPESVRLPSRVNATRILAVRERRRARSFASNRPLLLHVGCGFTRIPGWVNIDLVGSSADVYWDLLRPMPFAPGSADAVFHEHVLEHFPIDLGKILLRNCFAVLKPDGILRVAVPDVWRYAESYVNDPEHKFIQTMRPGHPTPLLAFQQIFFRFGHQTMFDFETLKHLLAEIGFVDVHEYKFGESALPSAPDSPHRKIESLYVECRRPR